MRRSYWLARAILFWSCSTASLNNAAAQNSEGVYWVRYQNQLWLTPRFNWNHEFDNRKFFDDGVQTQFIIHSRMQYQLSERWQLGGGLTLSWAYAANPESRIQHPTTEVRPVIELTHETPFRKWSLQQRFRMDNRFVETDRFSSIDDGANFIARFRYRIQGRIVLSAANAKRLVNLRLADEIMVNHKENFFDQNRIYATLDWTVHRNVVLEGGYIHIYQQRFATDEYQQRHVLRLTLLHRIFLYE